MTNIPSKKCKTLTGQWKDGELRLGYYYLKIFGDVERIDFFEGLEWKNTKDFGIEEIIAKVPKYEEYVELLKKLDELEKKLDITLETLGQIAMYSKDKVDAVQAAKAICDIKEVK